MVRYNPMRTSEGCFEVLVRAMAYKGLKTRGYTGGDHLSAAKLGTGEECWKHCLPTG